MYELIAPKEIARIILQSRQQKRGFLLCRFGHCESRVMGFPTHSTRQEVNESLRLQLGRDDYSDQECLSIALRVKAAYSNTDIVGLGQPQGEATGDKKYLDDLLLRVPRIAADNGLSRDSQQYCTANIHTELLLAGELDSIIKSAGDILVISCRDLAPGFYAKYGVSIKQLFVPQENRTLGLANELISAWHYPEVFDEIIVQIDRLVKPGTLVLIGAGFLGKIYGLYAKNAGGIVLDLGAVFDIWANIKSRSGFSDRWYEKYSLPQQARKSRYTPATDVPARKDATVDYGESVPLWSAPSNSGPGVEISGGSNAVKLNQNEVFIHSSNRGHNWIKFNDINIEARLFSSTIMVTNARAARTRFTFEVELNSEKLQFTKVCSPDDKIQWIQFLPRTGLIQSIKLVTSPISGFASSFGWAYIRSLRLF